MYKHMKSLKFCKTPILAVSCIKYLLQEQNSYAIFFINISSVHLNMYTQFRTPLVLIALIPWIKSKMQITFSTIIKNNSSFLSL